MKHKSLILLLFSVFQAQLAFGQSPNIAVDYFVTVNKPFGADNTKQIYTLNLVNNESLYFSNGQDDSLSQFINSGNNAERVELSGQTMAKLSDNHFASLAIDKFYKNYLRDTLIFNDLLGSEPLVVGEKISIFNWNVLPNKDTTILGYPCQSATTNFRGREYLAYFSPKLNNFGGPWKFDGLPGLILQVQSADNFFIIEPLKVALNTHLAPIQNPYKAIKKKNAISSWEQFVDIYTEQLLARYRYAMSKATRSTTFFSIDIKTNRIEDLGIGIVDKTTVKVLDSKLKAKKDAQKKKK